MRKINTTRYISVLCIVAILAGCTPTLQQVTQSREVYTATLHELNDLRHEGKISPAAHDKIEPFRAAAAKALDDMEAAARSGDKASYQLAVDAATEAVNRFVQIEQQAKGGN